MQFITLHPHTLLQSSVMMVSYVLLISGISVETVYTYIEIVGEDGTLQCYVCEFPNKIEVD